MAPDDPTLLNPRPAAPQAQTLSKDRLRLWLRLLRLVHGIEGELRTRFRDTDIATLPRFDVLATLERYPDGLSMGALSQKLKVSNGNVTGIVAKLVDLGWVERRVVKTDRRSALVRLTEAGRAAFSTAAIQHEQWIDELLGDIGPDELSHLIAVLGPLAHHRPHQPPADNPESAS